MRRPRFQVMFDFDNQEGWSKTYGFGLAWHNGPYIWINFGCRTYSWHPFERRAA